MITPLPSESPFWILELAGDDPNHRDVQQLDCPEAPGALVLFTTRQAAVQFRDASLSAKWILTGMSRDEVAAYLAEMHDLGAEHVAFDPEAGRENQAVRMYDAICRVT
jgi:hypothetical protein